MYDTFIIRYIVQFKDVGWRLLARITDILLSVLQVAFEPVQSNAMYTVKFEFR